MANSRNQTRSRDRYPLTHANELYVPSLEQSDPPTKYKREILFHSKSCLNFYAFDTLIGVKAGSKGVTIIVCHTPISRKLKYELPSSLLLRKAFSIFSQRLAGS